MSTDDFRRVFVAEVFCKLANESLSCNTPSVVQLYSTPTMLVQQLHDTNHQLVRTLELISEL